MKRHSVRNSYPTEEDNTSGPSWSGVAMFAVLCATLLGLFYICAGVH